MSEPRILGTARSHDDLVDLLRERKDEIGLSDAFIDEACLWPSGCGKLLGPMRVKTLGRSSLDGLLITLACRLVLVEDPERLAMMEAQWEQREALKVHAPRTRISKWAVKRLLPVILGEIARSGGLARAACLPGKQRSQIASKAARVRWRKAKAARKAKRPSGGVSSGARPVAGGTNL